MCLRRDEPSSVILRCSDICPKGKLWIIFVKARLCLFHSVQHTLCHCEERSDVAISRKGYHIKSHARYFCTCVEKKAQTSIRVSVIAPDNVISKAQFAPCSAILCQIVCLVDTFYGKNKPAPCQRDTFRAFFNYSAIKFLFVAECLSYFRIVEKVVFVQVFFVKRLYVGLCS